MTRETQVRILRDLEALIELARKTERGTSSSSTPTGIVDKVPSRENKSGTETGGDKAREDSSMSNGGGDARPGDSIYDVRRETWYGLPPGIRNAIANRAHEEVLPTYKEMVARFYEELAKRGK